MLGVKSGYRKRGRQLCGSGQSALLCGDRQRSPAGDDTDNDGTQRVHADTLAMRTQGVVTTRSPPS